MKKLILLLCGVLLVSSLGCGLTSKDTKPSTNASEQVKVYAASGKGLAYSPDSGVSWQHFAKSRTNGLADEHFSCVYFVSDKNYYAGTTRGLAMTTNNAESWVVYTSDDGMAGNEVRFVQKFGDVLYVGTNGGLSVSTDNAKTWHTDTMADGLPVNDTTAILQRGGMLYLGTAAGLAISTNNARSWTSVPVSGNGVNRLFEKDGKIYISTTRGLFVMLPAATGNIGTVERFVTEGFEDLFERNINFFVIDTDGSWWLGTDRGLARSNNKGIGWRRFDQSDGIDASTINDIAFKGLMVFLATDKGLSVSNDGGDAWVTYNKDDGLQSLTLKQLVLR